MRRGRHGNICRLGLWLTDNIAKMHFRTLDRIRDESGAIIDSKQKLFYRINDENILTEGFFNTLHIFIEIFKRMYGFFLFLSLTHGNIDQEKDIEKSQCKSIVNGINFCEIIFVSCLL